MSSLGKVADIINTLNLTASNVLTEQSEITNELNQRSSDLQKDVLEKNIKAMSMSKEMQTYANIGGSLGMVTGVFSACGMMGSGIGTAAGAGASGSMSKYGPAAGIILAVAAVLTGILSTATEGKTSEDLKIAAGTLGGAALIAMTASSASKMEPGSGAKGFGSALMQNSAESGAMLAKPLTTFGQSGFQVAQGIVQTKLAGVEQDLEHDLADSTTLGSGAKTAQKAMSSGFQLQETLQKTAQTIIREEAAALTHNTK